MSRVKVEAQSEPKLLGEAEVHWKIRGWAGPLAGLMRSKAECHVKIPLNDTQLPDIRLRFYLNSCHRSTETDQSYGKKLGSLNTNSTFCNSTMLLVDALNGPDNFALFVSVHKLDDKIWFGPRDNLLIVDNKLGYSELPVTVLERTEGTRDNNSKAKDVMVQMNVSVYQVTSTASEPKNAEQWTQKDWTKYVPGQRTEQVSNSDVTSEVILKTKDGMRVHARRSILIDKSRFIRDNLIKETSNEISLPVQGEALLFLLHWMYTGKIISADAASICFPEICVAAKELDMSPEFWSWFEANLQDFFQPQNLHCFTTVAKEHNLILPTDLKNQIQFVKKKMTEDENRWAFCQPWKLLGGILDKVNYLTVNIDGENPISTDSAQDNITSKSAQPDLTVNPAPASQENVQPTSSAQATTAAVTESASASDLSFKIIDNENGSLNGAESDNDSNLSSYEVVEEKTKKADFANEIQKVGTELANLLERYNKLTHLE